jgi:hypothetical protein
LFSGRENKFFKSINIYIIQLLDTGSESLAFDRGANGSNIDPGFVPFSVMCVSSDGL